MPVKANIPSIGTVIIEGAAEETTLKQLLSAMGKVGGKIPTGGSPSSASGGGDSDDIADRMKAGKKAEEAETKRNEKLMRAGEAANNILAESANNFSRSFSNVTPSIKDFSGLLSEYAPGAIGDTVKALGGVFDDQVQIFRSLSQSGIDLGDSLLTAQLAAGKARLPLEIFANTVKNNSQILSMAFGTASQGADKFAQVQGKFMDSSGKKFAALGFSMDEMAAYNASYIDQLQRSGKNLKNLDEKGFAALAEDMDKYNTELDKLSKATGISRQQLDEANQATQRDARMRLATQKLSKDQQLALEATTQQLNKLDPSGEFSAGIKDLVASGGVATTKAAKDAVLAASKAGVDLQGISRNIYNGVEGSVQDLNNGLRKVGQAGAQLSEGDRRLGVTMATMGQKTPGLVQASIAGFQDLTEAQAAAAKEQADKLKSQDPTRAAAGLDQTLTQVQNSLKASLIDTKIFDVTASGLNVAGSAATKMAKEFEEASLPGKIAMFVAPAAAKEIGALIKEYGSKALLTAGVVTAAASAAKMSKSEYEARKSGDLRPDEKYDPNKKAGTDVDKNKKPGVPGKGAVDKIDDAVDKPSRLSRIIQSGVKNRWAVVGTLVGGGLVYFADELTDMVLPDITKWTTGKMMQNLPPGLNTNTGSQQTAGQAQNQTGQMSKEVSELNTALKGVDFAKLVMPESVGTSIDQSNIKLKNLKDTITTTTSAFKDLNNVNLTTLNDSINKLSSTVEKQSTAPSGGNTKTSSIVPPGAEKEMVALLNQLNMNMGQMVSQQSDAVDYLSKTAKNTRQSLGNLL